MDPGVAGALKSSRPALHLTRIVGRVKFAGPNCIAGAEPGDPVKYLVGVLQHVSLANPAKPEHEVHLA